VARSSMGLTEFVGKILAESDVDVLREGVRVLAQVLMDAEATAQLLNPGGLRRASSQSRRCDSVL
jgi:hypothetical protein